MDPTSTSLLFNEVDSRLTATTTATVATTLATTIINSTLSNLTTWTIANASTALPLSSLSLAPPLNSLYHLPIISTTTSSYLSTTIASGNDTTTVPEPLSTVNRIVISVILTLVILGTVIGNILVCVAVCLVKKLRRPCNYLLVSLALSDLCVAVLVMPIALLYEVLGKWEYGLLFCDIWVSFDVLSCTASILNLCAISVDRYWAITKPLEYGVKRTPKRMLLCVALVWLGAACVSLPPLLILGNEHVAENGDPICTVNQNFGYQIYATFGAFYVPLLIMLFVYYQIFRAARRIVLAEKRAQTRLDQALNGGHPEKPRGSGGETALMGSPHQKKLRFQLAKERKASTTLGIIMSAFTVCWLPFFILAIVRPFLDNDHQVPSVLSSFFLWLGYANSLLNPIIYATLNRDFRKPFQEILFFRCSNLNTMMREEYYYSQYGEPASQRVVLGGEGQQARESFL